MSSANSLDLQCGQRPIWVEPLKTLSITNLWSRDRTVLWIPDCRRRRNADGRAAFQRRNRVHGPTQTAKPLGPVEAAPQSSVELPANGLNIVGEKNPSGVLGARGKQDNALTTLRKPEGLCVNNSVGPEKSSVLEFVHEIAHASAAIQLQHERHVFEHQPAGAALPGIEQTEDLSDKSRVLAADTGCSASLAQVLAGKARGDEINVANGLQVAHVAGELRPLEVRLKNPVGAGLEFAEQGRFMPGLTQPKLDAADACEESGDA